MGFSFKQFHDEITRLVNAIVNSGGGGVGSSVTWEQLVNDGEHIANITINGEQTKVFSSSGGSSGRLSLTLIGDFSSSPLSNNGQVGDLTDNITNYELLLVVGWSYGSSGNYEQRIVTLIPKALYFEHSTITSSNGLPLDWILNGSISTSNRRIGFTFDELQPNIIKVSYEDSALITHIFGIN